MSSDQWFIKISDDISKLSRETGEIKIELSAVRDDIRDLKDSKSRVDWATLAKRIGIGVAGIGTLAAGIIAALQ